MHVSCRNAPASDPLLATHYYDRTEEQHAALGFLAETHDSPSANQTGHIGASASERRHGYTPAGTTRVPHGSVGAEGAHRAIAHGNTDTVAAALFKYSAPEEVDFVPLLWISLVLEQ